MVTKERTGIDSPVDHRRGNTGRGLVDTERSLVDTERSLEGTIGGQADTIDLDQEAGVDRDIKLHLRNFIVS